MLKTLILNVIGISGVTGILALVLAAVRKSAMKNIASKWICMCWAILALRLLIPFNLPITLYEIEMPESSEVVISENTVMQTEITATSDKNVAEYTQRADWQDIILWVWLAGMAIFIGRQILVYITYRKRLLRWSRLASDNVREKSENIAAKLGVKQKFYVLVCAEKISPMLMGVFSPKLFLPAGMSEKQIEIALRHELTHLRRRDIVLKVLMTAANAAHWFNPLVYFMVREADREAEKACDEAVLDSADHSSRRAYCSTILDMMHGRRIPFATALIYKKEDIMKRFENILNTSKRKSGLVLTAILLCASVLLCGLVGCTEEEPAIADEKPAIVDETPEAAITEENDDSVNEVFDWNDGEADGERAMELINEYRMQNGLSSLEVDDGKLKEIAEKRLEEIQESFSHTRPSGEKCFTAFEEEGLSYTRAYENLARGQRTAGEVMNNWIDADADRGILLIPDVTHMYIACCEGEYGGVPYMYWVLLTYAP